MLVRSSSIEGCRRWNIPLPDWCCGSSAVIKQGATSAGTVTTFKLHVPIVLLCSEKWPFLLADKVLIKDENKPLCKNQVWKGLFLQKKCRLVDFTTEAWIIHHSMRLFRRETFHPSLIDWMFNLSKHCLSWQSGCDEGFDCMPVSNVLLENCTDTCQPPFSPPPLRSKHGKMQQWEFSQDRPFLGRHFKTYFNFSENLPLEPIESSWVWQRKSAWIQRIERS